MLDSMHELIEFIEKISPLDGNVVVDLNKILKSAVISKGSSILKSNTYCRNLFFIKKGIVKMGFTSESDEFIMRFFEEGIIFTDIESYRSKKVSKYEITAIEDLELIIIPLYQFENLCKEHHSLEFFFRQFMTMATVNMMDRIKEMLEEDAKKRNSNFTAKYPDLLQRISLGDLSKYLGITQVSLSRIRATK